MADRLENKDIDQRLENLPGWRYEDEALIKEFEFEDFVDAFRFMVGAAMYAEAIDHHPDWHNIYNRLSVKLSTHDAGGVTELDFELAGRMNELARTQLET